MKSKRQRRQKKNDYQQQHTVDSGEMVLLELAEECAREYCVSWLGNKLSKKSKEREAESRDEGGKRLLQQAVEMSCPRRRRKKSTTSIARGKGRESKKKKNAEEENANFPKSSCLKFLSCFFPPSCLASSSTF